jgi:hypothetical protein
MQVSDRHTQEIRFAIVLYGGVSLAIYINGVVQELLRLVRSTSGQPPRNPENSEIVYRKLGCLLQRGNRYLRRKLTPVLTIQLEPSL